MADYYTQFSCIFDVRSLENITCAHEIRQEMEREIEDEDGGYIGFCMLHDPDTSPGALWIYNEECGEPEHVIKFVLRCAKAMDLTGMWGFTWGLSCSKPRLDGYGGGAQVLDLGKRVSFDWIDCRTWLDERTTPDTEGDPQAAANAPRAGSKTGTAFDFMTGEEGVS